MSRKALYPVAQQIRQMCTMLDLSEQRVLERVGLPSDFIDTEDRGVDGPTYFAVWRAVSDECDFENAPIVFAQKAASRPCNSPMIAFTSSATYREGLERLALFKPLVAPIKLTIKKVPQGLSLRFDVSDEMAKMPDSFELFDLVYFVEIARVHTGVKIVPLSVKGPSIAPLRHALEAYFECMPEVGPYAELILREEDADLPLISANAALLDDFIPTLQRRLAQRTSRDTMAERVEATLREILPSGKASANDVCARLHLSRRSLQRRLHEEGQTFRALLDATRASMAKDLLAQGDVSVEEISYLLAYRDPNSFYRAFHNWTGMTPMQAREIS
ncbi:AraC family transcriptional regulator [uncultured Roseobacter sp.]|uniref:AraC family transcriptional regulator n=1 Tax=uncultured Roseobacter sp. TaxID=114847 RepID=UPI002612D4E6|nr:AraC family transcriptional regulator [uncultured Roseobacter sp.]